MIFIKDNETGVFIRLTFDPGQLKKDGDAIQKWVNQNLKISLPINLDQSVIKGLEQLGKQSGGINNVTTAMQNMNTELSKVSTIITKGADGIEKRRKEVEALEDSYGNLLKTIKIYKAGEHTSTTTENTTNIKKQKQAIDELNAAQLKLLNNLEKASGGKSFAKISDVQQRITSLDKNDPMYKSKKQEIENDINSLERFRKQIEANQKTVQKYYSSRQKEQQKSIDLMQKEISLIGKETTRRMTDLDRQRSRLNKGSQSALSLGTKIDTLAPGSEGLLKHQLVRYQKIIEEFQKKNELKIPISQEQLDKLQNLENRIKRFYDTIKTSQKDSHGFDFKQYEVFNRLSPAIQNAKNSQDYYNKSILEGWKLIKAQIQETEHYIKISQGLRQGSIHKEIGIYVDKNTGSMYKFNDSLRDATVRSWGLGEAIKTAADKAMIWTTVMGGIYGFINLLQQIPQVIVDIDTRLTEMSKVMSNDTNFTTLMQDATAAANQYGRTLTEVGDSLIEFGKAGYEAADATRMMEATLLGSNVTGLKAADMASYLTSTLSQFNLTGEEAVRVIDKINEVNILASLYSNV